jgi:microcystin-dependent protein
MADPYTGEIRIFGFPYVPVDWAACNGATLPLQQQTALFALIGITYGGNGTSTFQLPNLSARGFCGIGQGPGLQQYDLGETFGQASVALSVNEMALHNHQMFAYEGGTGTHTPGPTPTSALSTSDLNSIFVAATADQTFSPSAISQTGDGQPHENRQPGLPLRFCIATSGVFPDFP